MWSHPDVASARAGVFRPVILARWVFFWLIVVWFLGLRLSAALVEAADENGGFSQQFGAVPESLRIDFAAHIQPILQTHCIECHGPAKQKGELRLDGKEYVAAGGHTGNPILAGRPEDSELYLRVTSNDPKYRMPAKGPLLSPGQVQLISRWIEQGATWSTSTPQDSSTSRYRWVVWLEPFLKFLEQGYGYIRSITIPLLLFLAAVFFVERAKHIQRWARSETVAVEGLALVRREWYLVGALALGVAGLWSFHQRRSQAAQETIRSLQSRVVGLATKDEPPVQRGPFGGPIPPRPKHLKQLGGTYYRGNDERDERLFNGGFYRTATFRLSLNDSTGQPLQWGDAAPEGPLFVTLEIQRAKLATPALFTDAIMNTIFLSRQVALLNSPEAADIPAHFQTIEPGERWVARYPIRADGSALTESGMIYVYKGLAQNGFVDGKFHYGISYDLKIVDGVISNASEIWMGSLSVPVGLIIPPPDRMVLNEWFDSRPLPEIEGQNSTDPALLGIPEYLK